MLVIHNQFNYINSTKLISRFVVIIQTTLNLDSVYNILVFLFHNFPNLKCPTGPLHYFQEKVSQSNAKKHWLIVMRASMSQGTKIGWYLIRKAMFDSCLRQTYIIIAKPKISCHDKMRIGVINKWPQYLHRTRDNFSNE